MANPSISTLLTKIGQRIQGGSLVAPCQVLTQTFYATKNDDFVRLVTDEATGFVHGYIVEYRGWNDDEGAGGTADRILRFVVIGILQYEAERMADGLSSYSVFVDEVESIAQSFRRGDRSFGIPDVRHRLLQTETDFALIQISDEDQRRIHLLLMSLDVEVGRCV